MRLEIADAALDEAEQARDHYAGIQPELGADFLAEFRRSVDLILAYPTAWARTGHGARKRHMDQFPYSVVYRVDDQLIRIVAVMHQRQRPGYWRKR
jgi:plasmid stabilization system protein ParE